MRYEIRLKYKEDFIFIYYELVPIPDTQNIITIRNIYYRIVDIEYEYLEVGCIITVTIYPI